MCGRFVTASSPTLLAERFHAEDTIEATAPDYNVAPREDVVVVRERADGEATRRVLSRIRWGLVPAWAKDPSVGDRMINARAETLVRSSAYQVAFEKRRCLIPADGFYEWEKLPPAPGHTRGRRQPYFIHRRDGEPMAFAGLWAVWKVPDGQVGTIGGDDGWLRSCSIVTTKANDLLEPVHDRMPVVLPERAWDAWLDPTPATGARATELEALLVPAPDDWFEMYAVSERVNRVLDKGPELVRPLDASASSARPVPLDADTYRRTVRDEAATLVAAAERAGLDARVPSCPDWDVAALLAHIGRVHRWAAGNIAAHELTSPADAEQPPAGAALFDYARGGAAALSAELDRPADEPTWTFAPPPTVAFWQRRQAQETAMHRVDAELAGGTASPVDGDLAADGIDEWLALLPYRPGKALPTGAGETLHLHCTDRPGEWLLRLTGDGLDVEPTHAKGDVAVRGPASDLLLVLLHRAAPETVEVLGARPVLDGFLAETAF